MAAGAQAQDYEQPPTARPAGCPQTGLLIAGTAGANTLTGTPLSDVLRGGGGNDTLDALGGPDCLYGELGNDTLNGGDGNDVLVGAAGGDRGSGGTGNDRVNGDDGNDFLSGSSGGDRLFGGAGSDTLTGGSGADTLSGGGGQRQHQRRLGRRHDHRQLGQRQDQRRRRQGPRERRGGQRPRLRARQLEGHDRLRHRPARPRDGRPRRQRQAATASRSRASEPARHGRPDVYEVSRCSTCQKLSALLAEHGVEYDGVEYHETGLDEATIRDLLAKSGLRPRDILRTREPLVAELGLLDGDGDGVGDDELIARWSSIPSSCSGRSPCAATARCWRGRWSACWSCSTNSLGPTMGTCPP